MTEYDLWLDIFENVYKSIHNVTPDTVNQHWDLINTTSMIENFMRKFSKWFNMFPPNPNQPKIKSKKGSKGK